MSARLPTVGVMGAHTEEWPDLARPLGIWIAEQGFNLLTGGGEGVMTSVAAGFCSVTPRTGRSIGIIPMAMDEQGRLLRFKGYPNPHIEVCIQSPLGKFQPDKPEVVSRNHINVLSSDVVVALPGGPGTMNEIMLAAHYRKPIVLYGPTASFQPFATKLPHTDVFDAACRFVLSCVGKGTSP